MRSLLFLNLLLGGISLVSASPTLDPTLAPSSSPTAAPITGSPVTPSPTTAPSVSPSSSTPTASPVTGAPVTGSPVTGSPTGTPTSSPVTGSPTSSPSSFPTGSPVSLSPSSTPTAATSSAPTSSNPTAAPATGTPTIPTTATPSASPSATPTRAPTVAPTGLCPVLTPPAHSPNTSCAAAANGIACGPWVCSVGWTPSAVKTRYCDSGVWNGTAFTCTPILCPTLAVPTGATIAATSVCAGAQQGQSCAITCQSGDISTGSTSRTCNAGVWSGTARTCTPPPLCPPLESPLGSLPENCYNFRPGQKCVFECGRGYKITGPGTRTCNSSGGWIPAESEKFSCKRSEVNAGATFNGRAVAITGVLSGLIVVGFML